MKKKFIIRKNTDFNDIISSKRNCSNKYFKIFYRHNECHHPRFGITVSHKNGNAVVRNKQKRQIRSILDQKDFQKSLDCIIIIKKEAIELKYCDKRDELIKLLDTLKGGN